MTKGNTSITKYAFFHQLDNGPKQKKELLVYNVEKKIDGRHFSQRKQSILNLDSITTQKKAILIRLTKEKANITFECIKSLS